MFYLNTFESGLVSISSYADEDPGGSGCESAARKKGTGTYGMIPVRSFPDPTLTF